MSNIYVPIDSSNLSELIPEGEDILYSTLCKLKAYGYNVKANWSSHILISKSGFASFSKLKPYETKSGKRRFKERKKKEGFIAQFTKWEELGTNEKLPPFSKNSIVHILNPEASNLRRAYISYKDLRARELGYFCRDLWLDKVMK